MHTDGCCASERQTLSLFHPQSPSSTGVVAADERAGSFVSCQPSTRSQRSINSFSHRLFHRKPGYPPGYQDCSTDASDGRQGLHLPHSTASTHLEARNSERIGGSYAHRARLSEEADLRHGGDCRSTGLSCWFHCFYPRESTGTPPPLNSAFTRVLRRTNRPHRSSAQGIRGASTVFSARIPPLHDRTLPVSSTELFTTHRGRQ